MLFARSEARIPAKRQKTEADYLHLCTEPTKHTGRICFKIHY